MSSTSQSNLQTATLEEAVTTIIMARVTEYFGFFVYAIASALVFPRLFFPMYDEITGTFLSFAVFSLAFLARPFASVVMGPLKKSLSPAVKITLALMIFGSSTVAIGMLPSYATLGWIAPALLVFLRILQGIGLGAAHDGFTIQLQDAAPEGKKGLFDMVPQIGGPIGFVIAAAMFYVLTGFLTDEEFINWGWRFAFFAVMAVNVVSLFARLRLLNTDFGAGALSKAMVTTSTGELLRHQWRPILLSTFVPLASYALFHIVTVFPLGYLRLFSQTDIAHILLIQMVGGSLAILTVILSGVLADRFSKRAVMAVSSALMLVLCFTIETLNTLPTVFILFGFIVLGLAFGQARAIVPKRLEEKYRYSGAGLAINLSWITGAAFAPLIALALTYVFGLWSVSLYLLSGIIITFCALFLLERQKR